MDVDGLCMECRDMMEADYALGRDRIWDEVPEYFNLPSWSALKNVVDA